MNQLKFTVSPGALMDGNAEKDTIGSATTTGAGAATREIMFCPPMPLFFTVT